MISTILAGPITAGEVGNTWDKSPAHHRVDTERQASMRTHIHTEGPSGIACNHLSTRSPWIPGDSDCTTMLPS